MTENLENLVLRDDRIITVSDARDYFGGCIPGWQAFADAHNLDWRQVVKHGLLASELLSTEDAMALALVNHIYSKELPHGG